MRPPIAHIQRRMIELDLHAYFVPTQDEHLNEFLPDWRKRREFVTGFTGSAGDLLIGRGEAWLFVDGRYYLQADRQVEGTGITVVKLGTPGAKTLFQHVSTLAEEISGFRLGINPMIVPVAQAETLARGARKSGGSIQPTPDLVAEAWPDRPTPPTTPLLALPVEWTGSPASEKIRLLREDLARIKADATILVKLDQIAWLLNLRSMEDVSYNPVFEAYLALDSEEVHLFLHGGEKRLPDEVSTGSSIRAHEYEEFADFLTRWKPKGNSTKSNPSSSIRIAVDPNATTVGSAQPLEEAGHRLVRTPSSCEIRKAIKSPAEQEAARRANLRASVAKTKSLLWLRREVGQGKTVTEKGFAEHLENGYAQLPGFFGLSFPTISSTGANGAIIHYKDCDETPLRSGELFLIDSGAHIDGGSTDDTRTVAVGSASTEAMRLFTLVLKGHIRAANQRFPANTPAAALDTLARAPLWAEGLNYAHGTGHGIGAFLNIHEGPFGLSDQMQRPAAVYPLKPHMITSIEPGYYLEGWGGIRLENLYLIAKDPSASPAGAEWLRFECLTWIPFDPTLIDIGQLDTDEKSWLTEYQTTCVSKLRPELSESEAKELVEWVGH